MDRNCCFCGAQLPEEASFCPFCANSQIEKQMLVPPREKRKSRIVLGYAVIGVLLVIGLSLICFGREEPEKTLENPGKDTIAVKQEAQSAPQPTIADSVATVNQLEELNRETDGTGEVIKLDYKTRYERPNGSPSEGLTFTGVDAVERSDGTFRITVWIEAEQIFRAAVFEPPGGTWTQTLDPVAVGQKSIFFDMTREQLEQLSAITVRLTNYTDETRNTPNENTNWLFLQSSELQRLLGVMPTYVPESVSTPSPEPSAMPESKADSNESLGAIEVNYITSDVRPDDKSLEGVRFTEVSAVKLENEVVRFTVSLELERDCWISIFEPPDGNWMWGNEQISAGQREVSFDLSAEQLQELSAITVKVYEGGDKERVWLSITQNELRQIEGRLSGKPVQIEQTEQVFPSVGESVSVAYSVDYLNADRSICEDAQFSGLTATQVEYGNVRFTVTFELRRAMTLAVTGDWGDILEYVEANETSYSFVLTPKDLGMGGNLGIKLYCGLNGELGISDEIRTSLFVGETTLKTMWD